MRSSTDRPQPPSSRKSFEAALRKLGFSRGEAKKICKDGFHPGGIPAAEVSRALETLRRALSGFNDTVIEGSDDSRDSAERTLENPPPSSEGSPEKIQTELEEKDGKRDAG